MTQEDKELLLKDIYARIPYGVKGIVEGGDVVTTPLKWYAEHSLELSIKYMVVKNGWKPYLFPLSSMTDEQYDNFIIVSGWDGDYEDIKRGLFSCIGCIGYIGIDYIYDTIDWFNKNHFDYKGLIEKGLALDATGLNIY